MSNPTTFSYAQAAKGQSATPASSTSQESPTASQVAAATQTRDSTVAATNSESSMQAPTSSIDVAASGAKVASEQDTPASNPTAQTEPTASSESAKPVPPQGATDKSETETTQQSSDRQSRSSAPSSRSQESSDSRKPKKGKKSKTADKDSEAEQEKKEEPQPKIELAEAPIPSVNIWQQRLGEQATKSKPSAPARSKESIQASQESTTVKSKATTTGEVGASVGNSRPTANGSRLHRKGGDASRSNDDGVTRRSAPRGSRVNDREEKSSLPAISNSASWPTPETAASSEVKAPASTSSEKDDKDDANANKTEKKKWIAVPFVPTAKFNTPIPGRGAPRTGGRGGSRATRDAPARGGSNSVSSGVNGRPQETGSSTQGPSDSAKAVSTEASVSQETRKPAGPASVDSAKITGEAPAATTSGKPSQVVSENGTTERVSAPRSADGHKGTEGTKESASHYHRESHQGPNGTHRSSDRPRGGRGGRGGHNANGTTHQASYGHGSNGYSFHPNSRQGSQQAGSGYSQMPYSTNYSASSSGTNHRGRPNSVSLGRSQTNGGGRHNNPRLPHIQPPQAMPYDAQMYPQTAIPYDYFSANILALVQAQVDYYFSVDNLCKDYFLRKNMDSQGYVLLAVIANFRRMKEMTTDYDMIRAACEESHEVELVYAEDGQDRVRRATGWQSWVIQDVGSREYAAQNDGPQNVYRHNRPFYPQYHPQMMHNGFMPGAPPMFSPNGTNMGFMPYMNGSHMGYPAANGNGVHAAGHTDSQLSATVPEFAPTGFQTPQDHTAPETGKKGAPLPRNAAHHGAEASHGEAAPTNGTIQGQ